MENQNSIIFVIDEVGFGTKPLRRYAYSTIGLPAILYKPKLLGENLSCIATISLNGIELLRFLYKGGTTNEVFEDYFDTLLNEMKKKYPSKKLVFILDNCGSHKSSLIKKIM